MQRGGRSRGRGTNNSRPRDHLGRFLPKKPSKATPQRLPVGTPSIGPPKPQHPSTDSTNPPAPNNISVPPLPPSAAESSRRRRTSLPAELQKIRDEAFAHDSSPLQLPAIPATPAQIPESTNISQQRIPPQNGQRTPVVGDGTTVVRLRKEQPRQEEKTDTQQPSPQQPSPPPRQLSLVSPAPIITANEATSPSARQPSSKHSASTASTDKTPDPDSPATPTAPRRRTQRVISQRETVSPIRFPRISKTTKTAPAVTTNAPKMSQANSFRYSKTSYKRDAAFIVVLAEELEGHGFPHLRQTLTEGDLRAAEAVLSLVSRAKEMELRDRATADIHSQNSSASTVESFTRFLKRFRDGPSQEEEDATSDTSSLQRRSGKQPEKPQNSFPRPDHNGQGIDDRGRNGRRRSDSPNRSDRGRTSRQPSTASRRRQTPHGNGRPTTEGIDEDYEAYLRFKEFQRRERTASMPHNNIPANMTPRNFAPRYQDPAPPNNFSTQNTANCPQADNPDIWRQGAFGNTKRLRVDEVGTFDGTQSATAYCSRLTLLESLYGELPILATLPLCMKNTAETEWKSQLLRRFHGNPSQSLVEADNMKHSFDTENVLNVRDYISKKQMLYAEAGETNEDHIVRRIHDGLDPTLGAAVTLRPAYNDMNDFTAKVYAAEYQARAQYKQFNDRLNKQRSEFQRMLNGNYRPSQVKYAIPAEKKEPELPPAQPVAGTSTDLVPAARRPTTEVPQRPYFINRNGGTPNGNSGNSGFRRWNNFSRNGQQEVKALLVDNGETQEEYVLVSKEDFDAYTQATGAQTATTEFSEDAADNDSEGNDLAGR